jgi:hypothetical protein
VGVIDLSMTPDFLDSEKNIVTSTPAYLQQAIGVKRHSSLAGAAARARCRANPVMWSQSGSAALASKGIEPLNQRLKSVVRQIRTLRSVGAGGGTASGDPVGAG